jgi:hypothetical protein
VDVVDHSELDELDRPPAAWSTAAPPLTFDDWVRKVPYALAAVVGSFMLFPVLLGSATGPGVALLTSSASTWFFLGRGAPPTAFKYQLAVAGPFLLLLLLIT